MDETHVVMMRMIHWIHFFKLLGGQEFCSANKRKKRKKGKKDRVTSTPTNATKLIPPCLVAHSILSKRQ